MKMVTIIVRSFQPGAGTGKAAFDESLFKEKVAKPIRNLLQYNVVQRIVIISNGDPNSELSEHLIPGTEHTPTTKSTEEVFRAEVEKGRIITHICYDWGGNPGSATALNEGIDLAAKFKGKWVLTWSPEIEMDDYRIRDALHFAEVKKLFVVGFLREKWYEKLSWHVVQNTAALWHVDYLRAIGGFARECNGTGETIYIQPFGEVPVAGMEDFHALLRFLIKSPDFQWGMVGKSAPLKWNATFERGNEREERHLQKVARQLTVMKIYAARIFPEKSFEEVMDMLLSRCHWN